MKILVIEEKVVLLNLIYPAVGSASVIVVLN